MIKEAINRIIEIAKAAEESPVLTQDLTVAGQSYTFKTDVSDTGARVIGDMVTPLRPQVLTTATLTGFIDSVKAGFPIANRMVHIKDHLTVSLINVDTDAYGVRNTLLTAKHDPLNAFSFDTHYSDPAKFIIGLQVEFLQTQEIMDLIRMVSFLKAGNSVQTSDDGFSQTVTVKKGEIETADVKVPPRIKLIPIRSFSEIAHVQSEFLLRFNQGASGNPQPALFNVDGRKWIDETMIAIKHYLDKQPALKGVPVIA